MYSVFSLQSSKFINGIPYKIISNSLGLKMLKRLFGTISQNLIKFSHLLSKENSKKLSKKARSICRYNNQDYKSENEVLTKVGYILIYLNRLLRCLLPFFLIHSFHFFLFYRLQNIPSNPKDQKNYSS